MSGKHTIARRNGSLNINLLELKIHSKRDFSDCTGLDAGNILLGSYFSFLVFEAGAAVETLNLFAGRSSPRLLAEACLRLGFEAPSSVALPFAAERAEN